MLNRNRVLILAFITSGVFTVVVGVFTGVAANYLTPVFTNRPWLAWVILISAFLLSLPAALYLFGHSTVPQSDQSTSDKLAPSTSTLPTAAYTRFFGRDALLDEIMAALRDPKDKRLIGIDGMGGIGKTALAREVVERGLHEQLFEAVIWEPKSSGVISSGITPLTWSTLMASVGRQLGAPDLQRFSLSEQEVRLAALLASTKTLLVLDNLETATISQAELAEWLLPLIGSSKGLMTSRRRFKGDVYSIHLSGLDEENAQLLIRHEANRKNIKRVGSASATDLRKIVRTTGGSPLAMNLIVGQLQHLPLENVLTDLQDVSINTENVNDEDTEYERFYKGIFWNSWQFLSHEAQQLLVSMAVFAPGIGGTFDTIAVTADLNKSILPQKIDELWRFSFVEISDASLSQSRYYLHPLTQYFVLSDIVKEIPPQN